MLSPVLDIPEYVEIVTDSDGTVTHIFKSVTKKLEIVCVDKKGKPIKPLAKGENPIQPGIPTNPEGPSNPSNPWALNILENPITPNTTAAGFGALIAGIVIAIRRFQKEDK